MVYLVEGRCSSVASAAGPGSRLRSDGPAGSRRLASTGERRENSLAARVRTAPADFSRPSGASRRILKVAGCRSRRPRLGGVRVGRLLLATAESGGYWTAFVVIEAVPVLLMARVS